MNFIWVVDGKKLKQSLLVVACGFIAALIAFMNNDQAAVFSTAKSGPRAVSKVQTEKKQIALTFDIGWGDVRAVPILDILKEEGVQATFFVSGSWAEHHPEISKKIIKGKHEIASHGFGHKNYQALDRKDIRSDLMLSKEAIEKASGEEVSLIRPPQGKYNMEMLKTAKALHFTVISSSVDSGDVSASRPEEIVKNVVNEVSPGDII
ncbi:MAG TPA: polysaccharide deacetylase family protein, partial [Bacillales bacterium]|nr:polysaccharide deacetylase family protein [Bacillales bacterium]